MTTAQISRTAPRIAPPPSVEAVLGALTEETRIGQVDFSSRLIPEPETDALEQSEQPEPSGPPAPTSSPVATLQAVRGPADPESDPDPAEPAEPDDAIDGDDDVPGEAPIEPAAPEPTPETQTRNVETVPDHPVPAPLVARLHAPATLDDLAAADTEGLVMPDLDERPPSVEEIARLVVERMHDAELAMMRHLEAIEAEAARRCELLTAQAELDAELIRLNARREAHGIVSAARQRAEGQAGPTPEQQQLDELTESLSRFADVVDELRPSGPATPAGRTP